MGSEDGIRHVRFFASIPDGLVAFMPGFWWKQEELFRLDVEPCPVNLSDLESFLDVPIWRASAQSALFSVTARQILANPGDYEDHRNRIEAADIRYPISMYMAEGRPVLLDGYHRLVSAVKKGITTISAVYPTRNQLRDVLVEEGFLGELNEISQFDPHFIAYA